MAQLDVRLDAAFRASVVARDAVLSTAFAAHPERFPAGAPSAGTAPTEVWINKPRLVLPTEEIAQW